MKLSDRMSEKKNAYKIEAFWRNEIHHKCLTFDRESKKNEPVFMEFGDKNQNFLR